MTRSMKGLERPKNCERFSGTKTHVKTKGASSSPSSDYRQKIPDAEPWIKEALAWKQVNRNTKQSINRSVKLGKLKHLGNQKLFSVESRERARDRSVRLG